VIVEKETSSKEEKPEEPQQDTLWLNFGKIVFLIVVLVAAWFILDKLIGHK
jgi:hypothetical protein